MRIYFRKTEKKSKVPITESKRRRSVMYELVSYILIVIILLCAFLIFLDIGCVPSESMEPKIKVNDMIIGNNLAYKKKSPKRGDIVIFKSDEFKKTMCKRIIGLPGDTISFHNGYVYINDKKLDESKYLSDDIETNSADIFEVPKNSYFVLGDNRENSNDSRYWNNPFVPKDKIQAKVIVIVPLHTLKQ